MAETKPIGRRKLRYRVQCCRRGQNDIVIADRAFDVLQDCIDSDIPWETIDAWFMAVYEAVVVNGETFEHFVARVEAA